MKPPGRRHLLLDKSPVVKYTFTCIKCYVITFLIGPAFDTTAKGLKGVL